MYKIYINQSLLMLCSTEEYERIRHQKSNFSLYYNGNISSLHNIVDLLEKSDELEPTILYSAKLKSLWKDFKSIHRVKKAAGGVVFNDSKELLVIFRRGYWDLPKGHIEKNEKIKETAIREVEEECSVKDLKISMKVGKTYHIYRIKGDKILKKSTWYLMSTHKQVLFPQTKEDIEKAEWVMPDKFLKEYSMYSNIKGLLKKIEPFFIKSSD